MSSMNRRRALVSGAGIALGGIATTRLLPEELLLADRRGLGSRVAIVSALEYSERLSNLIMEAIRLFALDLPKKICLAETQSRRIHPGR